ncbi:helix-turn-helix transcriptional regulator [Enterococcus sp. RIT-PI-f]|uniref:helix-turn-helix transcriptional regulator n=1 Tax=Enterococcus sp. RIT-PI-f TaxID=1690244 RepID=UPI0006B94280|nr:helix-turn-helix transcriptional regulator [Enterococcus sp. RIT-PI-f]KPG69822.1 hypothetical protein AEQ18_10385 [Enterococcus sp. RIT-PI-f]
MQENLGKQLKEYRVKNHLTQKELAVILHVTDKAISKWERGGGFPDIETMVQIAKLLKMPIEDLLYYRKEPLYFEYRSQRMWLNVALMHILIPNIFFIWKTAVSIKDFFHILNHLPWTKGWFSLGIKAKGCLSLGIVSFGLLSIGVFSIGIIAIATASFGLIAIGNLSIAAGGAIGNVAIGTLVIGNIGLGLIGIANVLVAHVGVANIGFGTFLIAIPSNGQDHYAVQTAIQQLLNQEIPIQIKELIVRPLLTFMHEPIYIIIFVLLVLLVMGMILSMVLYGVLKLKKDHMSYKYSLNGDKNV